MKAIPTRTLNPLPFQDLEPHRFEDLVRQLAYDLRRWKSLEATGRSGSDQGLDIRGFELFRLDDDVEDDENESAALPVQERLWIFQCKREKSFSPQKIRDVIGESLVSLAAPPHGFVLSIASDVSKKARDVFREEMVARGIEEFFLWAKSEIEDMLFQPKNDRLLFAYFGISLQPRRRSFATTLRSEIAKKKQLSALLGEDERQGIVVLLRDPADESYPQLPTKDQSPAQWLACTAFTVKKPGHLVILRHEYLAATSPDGKGWDAIPNHDIAETSVMGDLHAKNAWNVSYEHGQHNSIAFDFWNEYILEVDKAHLKIYRSVPLNRILAIDPLGDGYFPVPHIFVDGAGNKGPFCEGDFSVLERIGTYDTRVALSPEEGNRIKIFPRPIPGELTLPPEGFDHSGKKLLPLSKEGGERLRAIFASSAELLETPPAESENAHLRMKNIQEQVLSFREWCEKTARPLLSNFVKLLREGGHAARVVIRSVDPSEQGYHASESVELRVRIRTRGLNGSVLGAAGHMRISWSDFAGWAMDVNPKPEETNSGSFRTAGPAIVPKIERIEKDDLECRVIAMIERLKSRGY